LSLASFRFFSFPFHSCFEAKLDISKLMKHRQRPHPEGADSIGTWFHIFSLISFLAVVTNVALLCFSTHFVKVRSASA
jgi:hypothetical protein